VLSSSKNFRDEYLAHIQEQTCPAGGCKDLVTYFIVPEACIGCGLCARRCPVNVISGDKRKPHVIDQANCIKCGECYNACKFDAVIRK
jgi:NAD-dependent dihydropyrimidine dehydrogenase PreA subunit